MLQSRFVSTVSTYVVTTYFNRHTGKLSLRRYYVASSFTIMYETTHIERHPSSLSYFRIHGERVSELLLLGEESLSPAQSPTHQCHTHDMRSLVTEGNIFCPSQAHCQSQDDFKESNKSFELHEFAIGQHGAGTCIRAVSVGVLLILTRTTKWDAYYYRRTDGKQGSPL